MRTKIKIDKGVPLPERARGPRAKYPFEDMAPGDSFLVERGRAEGEMSLRNRIYSIVGKRKSRSGEAYTVRQVRGQDGRLVGFRVWRVG